MDLSFSDEAALDYLPLDRLRVLQAERLRSVVQRVYERVPAYADRMKEADVRPDQIKGLDDIVRLPFTTKLDLRDHYPFGLFASPMRDVVRLHASSGTTGKPIVVAYTRDDINTWSQVMLRTFRCVGVGPGDIVQNAYGYGLFTGGLGAHYGLERLGATVIPMSGGNTDRQVMVMRDFGVTAVCATPSYFLLMLERASEMGVDPRSLPVRVGVLGAEPWTDQMRERIEAVGDVKAYDIYGLSEIIGPGVASECEAQQGLHIFEDHFYPEVIDPDTGQPVPDGQEGELVLTTLTKQGIPMIRYRTRDVTRLIREPCACGRSVVRMERVSRRTDDMLIIRGVNVYPSQVEAALLQVEGTMPHYVLVVDREGTLDTLSVQVEVSEEVFSDEVRGLERLERDIASKLESVVGLRMGVKLVEPRSIERSMGKAKRVIDNRKAKQGQ
ncbi:MAG TPA: phenylacetate--CoA ligase [Phycisphaerae bacterium]|nr:phenylacetate--CoA ligase [Phycisphaerae bacterium]